MSRRLRSGNSAYTDRPSILQMKLPEIPTNNLLPKISKPRMPEPIYASPQLRPIITHAKSMPRVQFHEPGMNSNKRSIQIVDDKYENIYEPSPLHSRHTCFLDTQDHNDAAEELNPRKKNKVSTTNQVVGDDISSLKRKLLPNSCVSDKDCHCSSRMQSVSKELLLKQTLLYDANRSDDDSRPEIVVLSTCIKQYIEELYFQVYNKEKDAVSGETFSALSELLGLAEIPELMKPLINLGEFHTLIWQGLFKNHNASKDISFRRRSIPLIESIMSSSDKLQSLQNISNELEDIGASMSIQKSHSDDGYESPPQVQEVINLLSRDKEYHLKLIEENCVLKSTVHDLCRALQRSDAENLAMSVMEKLREGKAIHKENEHNESKSSDNLQMSQKDIYAMKTLILDNENLKKRIDSHKNEIEIFQKRAAEIQESLYTVKSSLESTNVVCLESLINKVDDGLSRFPDNVKSSRKANSASFRRNKKFHKKTPSPCNSKVNAPFKSSDKSFSEVALYWGMKVGHAAIINNTNEALPKPDFTMKPLSNIKDSVLSESKNEEIISSFESVSKPVMNHSFDDVNVETTACYLDMTPSKPRTKSAFSRPNLQSIREDDIKDSDSMIPLYENNHNDQARPLAPLPYSKHVRRYSVPGNPEFKPRPLAPPPQDIIESHRLHKISSPYEDFNTSSSFSDRYPSHMNVSDLHYENGDWEDSSGDHTYQSIPSIKETSVSIAAVDPSNSPWSNTIRRSFRKSASAMIGKRNSLRSSLLKRHSVPARANTPPIHQMAPVTFNSNKRSVKINDTVEYLGDPIAKKKQRRLSLPTKSILTSSRLTLGGQSSSELKKDIILPSPIKNTPKKKSRSLYLKELLRTRALLQATLEAVNDNQDMDVEDKIQQVLSSRASSPSVIRKMNSLPKITEEDEHDISCEDGPAENNSEATVVQIVTEIEKINSSEPKSVDDLLQEFTSYCQENNITVSPSHSGQEVQATHSPSNEVISHCPLNPKDGLSLLSPGHLNISGEYGSYSCNSSDSGKGESETSSTPEDELSRCISAGSDDGMWPHDEVKMHTDEFYPLNYIPRSEVTGRSEDTINVTYGDNSTPKRGNLSFKTIEEIMNTKSDVKLNKETNLLKTNDFINAECYDNVKDEILNDEHKASSIHAIEPPSVNMTQINTTQEETGIKRFFVRRCKSFNNFINTTNFKRNSLGRSSTNSLPEYYSTTRKPYSNVEAKTKSIFKSHPIQEQQKDKSRRITFGGVTKHCPSSTLSIIESKEEHFRFSPRLNDEKKNHGVKDHDKLFESYKEKKLDDKIEKNIKPEKPFNNYPLKDYTHIIAESLNEINSVYKQSEIFPQTLTSLTSETNANRMTYKAANENNSFNNQIESNLSILNPPTEATETDHNCSSQQYLSNLELEMMEVLKSLETDEMNCI